MRARMGLAAALASVLSATVQADPSPEQVQQIVDRLGSGVYRDREAATRELDALGAAAVDALRRAVASTDPETRRRAGELLEQINERLATARILTPSTVDFKYENKPLAEAVADFNGRTGATISLYEASKFRGRTITAATPGPVPFWDAVELFCRKADLKEWDGATRLDVANVPQAAPPLAPQFRGQIFIARSGRRLNVPAPNAMILQDGPGPVFPSCRSGAVRVRVLPIGTPVEGLGQVAADEVILPLQVSAEPKLHWQRTVDIRIDRAIDERGRLLNASPAARDQGSEEDEAIFWQVNGMLVQSQGHRAGPVGVRVQRGDKPAARLAELAGTIVAQVRLSEPLARVDAPLKASGQAFHGTAGVSLKITSANRANSGEVAIGMELSLPTDVQLAANGAGVMAMPGQLQIQAGVIRQMRGAAEPNILAPGATEFMGLSLEDSKGKRFTAVRGGTTESRFTPEAAVHQLTATFKPAEPGQEPIRLVFTATRPATIEVPFLVKDVPLQ
jgi:hypothetical protein